MKLNTNNPTLTPQKPRPANTTGPDRVLGIETLQPMKTNLTTLKLLIVICAAFSTMAVFGQPVVTWTNPAGGLIPVPSNWDPNVLPNGNDGSGLQQAAQWDGRTPNDLIITNT